MPPYLAPLHIVSPTFKLPASCKPENDFLYQLSVTLQTCVPTNLALVSSLLGACSILSWLGAQLPQIYKNHKIKSTSGLSALFLGEWLLGDVSNLLGCLFTGQASWQIIIATYYVIVDCCLCSQWVWYELLHHGRPLRPMFGRWNSPETSGGDNSPGIVDNNKTTDASKTTENSANTKSMPRSDPISAFQIPNFSRSSGATKESWQNTPSGSSPNPNIRRVITSSSPMPSPRTVLYLSLLLAVLSPTSLATPASSPALPFQPHNRRLVYTITTISASEVVGTIFSWMSTFLYLGSRLPQLYKNQVRKSTAGLSPTLFAAAFFGNLFYSTSLLANPCAWNDYAPGQGAGWVSPDGSNRNDWIPRAAPFFLGAAGVLIMDALVGLQFVYFGDTEPRGRSRVPGADEVIITVTRNGKPHRRRLRWRRVSGWMRGWAPAVSVAATPSASRAGTPADTPRAGSPASGAGSHAHARGESVPRAISSQSIPIRGTGSALDEARALLGTGRCASPRSYGAMVGSPRSPARQ